MFLFFFRFFPTYSRLRSRQNQCKVNGVNQEPEDIFPPACTVALIKMGY